MDDLHKLHHLIEHWIEHNEGHIASYEEWAARADAMDKPEIAAVLREVAGKTRELNKLFVRAK
jgi:hypothetical protein